MGLNQLRFAELLGITRSALGSYEEQRAQPSLLVIAKAMEVCQIPAEDMYDFVFDENYLK